MKLYKTTKKTKQRENGKTRHNNMNMKENNLKKDKKLDKIIAI